MYILDLADPEFNGSMSSDELWYGGEVNVRLTDVIAHKSDYDHTHTGYAASNHIHNDYANLSDIESLQNIINNKADATHTHSDYATTVALDTLAEEVDGKADISHIHTDYAALSHEHDEYAPASHAHSEYASASHSHNEYASSSHTHSEYSVVGHDHDEDYAVIDHSHSDYATVTSLNEVSATVANKANASHSHNDVYYTETEIDNLLSGKASSSHVHTGYEAAGAAADALVSANAYTDSKIDALVGEGASTTLDTIGEISAAIVDNQDTINLLNSAIANKANVSDLNAHANDSDIHVSQTDKNNWNAAHAHSQAAHAPANAQANQNAFSNVVVGSTTISADTTTDTLNLVSGSNITLTPNATNDSITISATDTVYTHPSTTGNKHIPAGGSSGQILRWSADGTAVWGADNNTTYSNATQSVAGLMSSGDKAKLDGIASGANAYTLPTASSTLGGVKTTSTVTSSSGYTACPIISGVPYYKDTNTTYNLGSFGITATATELNYVDGVTSNIQTQLNAKASSSHNHSGVYADAGHTHTASAVGAVASGDVATVAETKTYLGI